MEFVANRKQLLAGIELAATVADPKASMPILSMVRLEARAAGRVEIFATDLVRAYEGDVAAEVRRSGAVCVDAKNLRAMLANGSSETVTVNVADNLQLRLAMGTTKARLGGAAPDNMPTAPVFKGDAAKVDGPTLRRVLDLLMPMVSTDTSRPHLAAVHFEAEAAAATNGNAAAVFEAATGVPPMLLPEAAARAWLAVLKDVKDEVAVRVGGNGAHVALETPAGRFSSKTVDATFPRWREVVPRGEDWTVTLDAKAFRVACAGMPHRGIRLVPSEHELTVESEDIESACFRSATVEWTVNKGTPCTIGFNAALLQGALRTDGAVTLSGTGELDPVTVRHVDEPSFLGLVMPMRIA